MTLSLSGFRHELKHALRQLRRRFGYGALAVAVLACGLGSTIFVLVAINALVIDPLPLPHADRVVNLGTTSVENAGRMSDMASQDFLDLNRQLNSYELLAAYYEATINLADANEVQRYEGVFVAGALFDILGDKPLLGRTLTKADDRAGAEPLVVIGESVWRNRFGADPQIIGRSIRMNALPATIVGVMPEPFAFPRQSQVWATARFEDGLHEDRQLWGRIMGRLKPGVSADVAAAELASVYARLQPQRMELRRDRQATLLPLAKDMVSAQTRSILFVMLATALSVLLLACANVANLQLGSLAARSREFAVRAAIGAGRGRIILGVLCESLIMAAIATVIALAIADAAGAWTENYFIQAEDSPGYWFNFRVDGRVAAMAALVALLTTALAGIVPALRASGFALTRALNDSGQSGEGRFSRIGGGLIIGQIALSCLLLIGAGMTWRGLQARADFDLGIDTPPASLMTARIAIFPEQYPTPEAQEQFFAQIVDKLRADSNVVAATAAETLPGSIAGGDQAIVEGQANAEDELDVFRGSVDDYFALTYGVRVLNGRFFDSRDQKDSQPVVVVDQRFADHFWKGQDPLNRRVKLDPDDPESQWATVVGVIRPLQLEDVDDDPQPSVLLPMRQSPVRFVSLAVHTRGDPSAFAPRIAEIVREINPDTPVYWLRTLEQVLKMDGAGDRFLAGLFGIFGLIGLLLAAAGLYGVLAQSITRRTREIGIRRAIGAETGQVARHVAAGAIKLVLIGMVIGLGLGIPWAKLLISNTLNLPAFDPLVFSLVAVSVLTAAFVAVLIPARRAIRIDPMQALRYE
ncbi:MAG: ABC transporter permease [Pseudomonadota bacterium]|nr:ABC transporter permease [Pseudomonadota bacterium]